MGGRRGAPHSPQPTGHGREATARGALTSAAGGPRPSRRCSLLAEASKESRCISDSFPQSTALHSAAFRLHLRCLLACAAASTSTLCSHHPRACRSPSLEQPPDLTRQSSDLGNLRPAPDSENIGIPHIPFRDSHFESSRSAILPFELCSLTVQAARPEPWSPCRGSRPRS